jgi:transcriptional regulator of acetoin/glycerol metabolism
MELLNGQQDVVVVLERNKGNVRKTAIELKCSRVTVYKKILKFGLDLTKLRQAS